MDLNKILGSSCRQKILRVLSKKQTDINIMALVGTVKGSYNEVNRNLKILENEGVITQRTLGYQRIITLNKVNKKTVFLLNILKALDSSIDKIKQSPSNYYPLEKERHEKTLNKSSHLKKAYNSNIIEESELIASKSHYIQQTTVVPDVLSLLSLPKPLRKTMIALYKRDQATAEDISKETNRPRTLEKAYANQLAKQGFVKKRKVGRKIFFYIETLLK